MDLSNPWSIFSGLFIGCIGMALFMYGKKQADFRCLLAGVGLCVFPYFVSAVWLMWVMTVACLALLYMTREGG